MTNKKRTQLQLFLERVTDNQWETVHSKLIPTIKDNQWEHYQRENHQEYQLEIHNLLLIIQVKWEHLDKCL
jgi:hypothetical protein